MNSLYDPKHCLVNVANSFLRHFQLPTYHPSLASLDEILLRNPDKKIALVLLDGLGKAIQESYPDACPFILSGKKMSITSVFPPTTVAATTALITGKFPGETGWMGWQEQFEEFEDALLMFSSCYMKNPTLQASKNTYEMCPYVSIIEQFQTNGIQADQVHSFLFSEDPYFSKFFLAADDCIQKNRFSYLYCTQPDAYLHEYGVGSREVGIIISLLDYQVKRLVEKHPDTLFVVLADHGHKNCIEHRIDEHEDFFQCLKLPHFALEPRAAAFFVKEGQKENFLALAKKYYGNQFDILSKEEVLAQEVFGPVPLTKRATYTIGDFLLISKGADCFKKIEDVFPFQSHHAGSSPEEKEINIAIFHDENSD